MRRTITNREDWTEKRGVGIGASEAAAVVGLSPWTTALELWELKTGMKKPKDLSGNEAVQTGHRLEPALRQLFLAMNPAYSCEYHEFDMVYQKERPWMFATLDGELTDTETGSKGVLEIKTGTPTGREAWEKWNERIPDGYFVQVLHQLACTGYDFAIVFALLFGREGQANIRTYRIEREDVKSDMEWLIGEEAKFWKLVQNKEMPGVKITF